MMGLGTVGWTGDNRDMMGPGTEGRLGMMDMMGSGTGVTES